MSFEVLSGDPAPAQECALLVLTCKDCGNSIQRWRPTLDAEEFGALVILMGLRCVKCHGPVKAVVEEFAFRVPEGSVKAEMCESVALAQWDDD